MTKLALAKIVIDESLYPRNGMNHFMIPRMVSALETGAKFPPLVVEARTNRLVDGRHRYEMYRQKEIETVEVTQKTYASEADLFADAVRLNVAHGVSLDQYSVRAAIIRLESYGYKRQQISDVVRLSVDKIEKIVRGFATDASGAPVALKGGLSHMSGEMLNADQIATNKHYVGGKAVFYINQVCDLLENGMAPNSVTFVTAMNRLIDLWAAETKVLEKKSA